MTISTTVIKNSYSGNGSNDTFAYTFKISANADMQVIIRASTGTETVKNLTSHYTVTGAGSASGGNVVFTSGNIPTATETVVLRRNTTQTQAVDLVENDPFTADSVEGAFDKNLSIAQELQEQIDRSIKISRTNTMTSTEFTNSATDRASKILAFDTNGELSVTSELGSYKGDWATATAFAARDIVKDTSNNNIYICNTAHTSSGSQPISSNTDVAKWDLLVDAASATTSQTAAASSATAAAASATTASTQATNASNSASAAATSASNASTSETNAASSYDSFDDRYLGSKSSNPSVDNDGDALATGALYWNSSTNQMFSYTGSAWVAIKPTSSEQTAINNAATNATNAANSATAASNSATAASSAQTAAETAKTAAETAKTAAETAADNFDDTYLGAKSSDPSVDNDGDALTTGDLYFNTSSNNLKVYTGSAWENAAISTSGFATTGLSIAMAVAL